MNGVYEYSDGGLYHIIGMGELVGEGLQTMASVCIFRSLDVDKDDSVQVMAVVEFQRLFRRLSSDELETRVKAAMQQAREAQAPKATVYHTAPKDAEIARPQHWDERDIQRGYKRGYDFQGTDNQE